MKYPLVIIYRYTKYNYIDDFIESNKDKFECTIKITNDINDINLLFNSNYNLLIIYGEHNPEEYYPELLSVIPKRLCKRWIFMNSDKLNNIDNFNNSVNYCHFNNVISDRESDRPVFSIFTSCYNTYDKIDRAYKSILDQKLIDWEWVILDDSPDDDHFIFLKEKLSNDNRIRLYKRAQNSGNIGNVKNETVSLCRGKYLLELDHDDIILPDCLLDAYIEFENDSQLGFIYMDFINMYENCNYCKYDNGICKGYGGYYLKYYKNTWQYVYITPNINNITLSHLTCLPNHPRIWRAKILHECGNYSEYLPICDDYEILLRTLTKYKSMKINKLAYIQFMNDNNNNFSLIRNAEINRVGPCWLYPLYYDKYNVHQIMKGKDAYENESYLNNHSRIWKRSEDYKHKYCNLLVNRSYNKQYCVLSEYMMVSDYVKQLCLDKSNEITFLSNTLSHDTMIEFMTSNNYHNYDNIKCYYMTDCSIDELKLYYINLFVNSNCSYEFIEDISNIKFNTLYNTRYDVINSIINDNPNIRYMEIGVEYGVTIQNIKADNKTGIDPDPKFDITKEFSNINLVKKTSDDYFYDLNQLKITDPKINNNFDIIFIDGMHQIEYVIKDITNSLSCLTENGRIFLDDILPINEREQHKIPIKHFYENDILKYGEPWTGDVWKVLYYLLLKFKDLFSIKVFTSNNHRGIATLYNIGKINIIINSDILEEINNYDYINDFKIYRQLLYDHSISDQ